MPFTVAIVKEVCFLHMGEEYAWMAAEMMMQGRRAALLGADANKRGNGRMVKHDASSAQSHHAVRRSLAREWAHEQLET